IGDERADRAADRDAFVVVEVLVFRGDDRVDEHLRHRVELHRQPIFHLVVEDGGDQLRLDAHTAQRDAVIEPLHITDFGAVERDQHRQRMELDVGIVEVLEIDLEVAVDVAILAGIRDALADFVVADVIQLRLEQRARIRHARHERRRIGVDAARQIPPPRRVEFLRDRDVGQADEADEGNEDHHHQRGESGGVAPEEVFDPGTVRFRHWLRGYAGTRACGRTPPRARGPASPRIHYIELIAFRNSAFDRVLSSFSMSSSIDSTVESGENTLRRTHTRLSSGFSSSSSSLRVPDLLMSIAGKTRLSESLRSRCTSMLPVPLNSSKMTSSMREPVSMSAVAMIVSEPPSSIFRAAPKNRFGRCSARASTPPDKIFPECGTTVLCARARRVFESSRIMTS